MKSQESTSAAAETASDDNKIPICQRNEPDMISVSLRG